MNELAMFNKSWGKWLCCALLISPVFISLDKAQAKRLAPFVGYDLSGTPCTGRADGYGPYDYTNPKHRGQNLYLVESAHFTKEVEMLIKGNTATNAVGDLDYTLRAFPNHHRALYAMMRYQQKQPDHSRPPVECYYQRAMNFSPNDYRVMQLYAHYLTKKKKPQMAISVYKKALSTQSAPPAINYSLGLLYFDMKKVDDAVEQAKIAYSGGVKKSKLARKLKEINRWPVE